MDKSKIRDNIINGTLDAMVGVGTGGIVVGSVFQAIDRFKAKDKKGGALSVTQSVLGLTLGGLMIYDHHRKPKK